MAIDDRNVGGPRADNDPVTEELRVADCAKDLLRLGLNLFFLAEI